MDFRYLVLYPALLLLLASLVIPILPVKLKSTGAFLTVLISGVCSSVIAIGALPRDPFEFVLNAGWVFGDVVFRVDALSGWFILIINLSCITGCLYGIHYMKAYLSQRNNLSLHWIAFAFFHASMIWVASVQHGLAFLIVWEIMSVSSFLLVMFDYTRFATLKAGMNYLVQAHIGVTFLSLGFIWVWISEGTFDFVAIGSFMEKGNALWLFILFLIGFGIKAGFIPLHTWLPHAHPAAPAHVSGIMSGVMVAMGIYGLLRVTTYLATNLSLIGGSVLVISAATAFYGVISAAIHRDYKRILAFSTIENMGIIGMGIGIGLIGKQMGEHTLLFLGFGAALLHTLNHSLYKPLMFYSSGNLYHLTNTRNIEQLGGLIRKIPFTAFIFLCGSLAISGLPPFNGFISKFLLFSGFVEGMNIESFQLNIFMIAGVLTLALVGGISTLAFTKSFSVIFLGTPRRLLKNQPQERFNTGHLPLFILLFLMLLIGLSPGITLNTLGHIVYLWDNSLPQNATALTFNATLSGIGLASLIVILLTGFVYTIRTLAVSKRVIQTTPTWACGYSARNRRMQYTGKAFSKSLAKLFAFITNEEKKYTEIPPATIFPSNRSYESSYAEYFEKHFINKVCHQLLNFMNRFSFIHNGRVQYYILYGFIFMLILIVATFFNIL